MSRVATCVALLICASSLACRTGLPAGGTWPAGCVEVQGSPVTIPVDNLAKVPTDQECIVLDKDAEVRWEGSNIKSLLVGWKAVSSACAAAPTFAPDCAATTCIFKSAGVPETKVPLCYGIGVIDNNGGFKVTDPRLIIRP
jgi:hypothetical protein